MAQELRETAQEMMRTDSKDVEDILNARPVGHYWIVICHKPVKNKTREGQHVLMRMIKAYNKKPKALLGTIILEVINGQIVNHKVNVHDMPIDNERLSPLLGLESDPSFQSGRRDIAGAYAYNNL